jgi:lipid II:glycine glycyltransferase (peptidoglycan interpeptide bridge formation enzyme)
MNNIRLLTEKDRQAYDRLVGHPLQSWAWGQFRELEGKRVIRLGRFQGKKLVEGQTMTVHPVPRLPGFASKTILYCPRSAMPSQAIVQAMREQAVAHQAILVKLEPDVGWPVKAIGEGFKPSPTNAGDITQAQAVLQSLGLRPGRPLFTPYNFWLDLTPGESELMKNMKSKTRYNIHLATKKSVKVVEDNSEAAFERYLALTKATTARQSFYAHTEEYHRQMWQVMRQNKIAHLLTATYQGKILTTWILFIWHDTLYYPYGASSDEHRNVMSSNLMMWEAIRFGKKNELKRFDMWGTAGLDPDPGDSWYGFHKFKLGYGPEIVEYVGTYDLVIDQVRYPLALHLDSLRRWGLKWYAKVRR